MCLNLNYDAAGTNLIRSKYDSLLVFPSQPFGECVCVCACVCVGAGTLLSLCWFLATLC